MKTMFHLMSEKLRAGEALVLVTVIASSGATPRGAGARMLVGNSGRLTGTIGGGAVEYRSEQIARQILEEKCSGVYDFNLTRDDVQNLGMICGGAVKVFFCYLPAGDPDALAIADKAEMLFAQGEDVWLISHISNGGKLALYTRGDGFLGLDAPHGLEEQIGCHTARIALGDEEFYIEQIHSSSRVYIFGCGHVAQELVPVLDHIGFRCVAMDDRPEFADRALFPTAEEVLRIDFENIHSYVTITEQDYVCVMTRGHAFDTVVQAQVLKTPACYVGVIGSAHKKAGVFQTLKDTYGITDADLTRITSPIGLDIKAETPAEIAISIAGQMIEVRASLAQNQN